MSLILPSRHVMGSTRGSVHGVMANSGFGNLTIYRRDGAVIELPQSALNSQGLVKNGLRKELKEITMDKIESLEKRGVKLYVGKAD